VTGSTSGRTCAPRSEPLRHRRAHRPARRPSTGPLRRDGEQAAHPRCDGGREGQASRVPGSTAGGAGGGGDGVRNGRQLGRTRSSCALDSNSPATNGHVRRRRGRYKKRGPGEVLSREHWSWSGCDRADSTPLSFGPRGSPITLGNGVHAQSEWGRRSRQPADVGHGGSGGSFGRRPRAHSGYDYVRIYFSQGNVRRPAQRELSDAVYSAMGVIQMICRPLAGKRA